MNINQGFGEGISEAHAWEIERRLVADMPKQVQRHVDGPRPHQILKEITLRIVYAYVAHFTVQIAGIVNPQHQPLRWLKDMLRIVHRIQFPYPVGDALDHS